jgi:superfamily I DNA and/or RNA helicase
LFLDTQCKISLLLRRLAHDTTCEDRMPVLLGNFISKQIYDGRLKTVHSITSASFCRLIDVANGREEKRGCSYVVRALIDWIAYQVFLRPFIQNTKEVTTVLRLVRAMMSSGNKFRIITGYDAQRSLLENELKREDLDWEDKCFSVDSFQGKIEFFVTLLDIGY